MPAGDLARLLDVAIAARHVPAALRATLPAVPWQDVVGVRNRVIHEYATVDLPLVWTIALEEVPKLLADIEPFLPEETP